MLGEPSRARADALCELLSYRREILELLGRNHEARAVAERAHSVFNDLFSAEHPHTKLLKQKTYEIH